MSQRIRAILTIATCLVTPIVLSGCLTEGGTLAAAADPTQPIQPPSANNPPIITGTPPSTIKVGVNYSFVPVASDLDRDPISFIIQNMPSWASFDASTGALFGVPPLGSDRLYQGIIISVSDGSLTTSMTPFSILVQPASVGNQPPQISGTPVSSVVVGERYSWTPDASDPEGSQLTFSVSSEPNWLTINPVTGELSGTPQSGDLGAHANIRITVSDGELSASLARFTVTVVTENTAPEISGTPPTQITVGQEYTFTPDAMDVDGDTLTFGVQNLPGWASFFPQTGEITGTPAAGQERTYSGIVISVTDTFSTASLPAFSITVNAASLGSATLMWEAPTLNSDGSQLTDLAGYIVYYGLNANQMSNQITVNGAGNTTYTVENLSPNTWSFGVAAKNTAGVISDMSNVATKTIN